MADCAKGWPKPRVLRRAVPSAPGVGMTRHPVTGAVWQRLLPYGNLLQIQKLAIRRSRWLRRGTLRFLYGNLLILLGVTLCSLFF
jgi:hypothetical protein